MLSAGKWAVGDERASGWWVLHCSQDSGFEPLQIVDYGSPDRVHLYLVVLMSKPVADTADVAPRKAWAENFGLLPEADGGFANDLELALDSRDRFRISPKFRCVHVQRKLFDCSNRFSNIAQR